MFSVNAEGGDSVKAGETGAEGENYETSGQGVYVFKEENYDNLMKYGKAYEIVLTSDKRIDGYFLSNSTENGTLEIDVWRSNSNIFKPDKKSKFITMWIDESGEFNEIHDFDTNEVVWK